MSINTDAELFDRCRRQMLVWWSALTEDREHPLGPDTLADEIEATASAMRQIVALSRQGEGRP